MRGYQLISFKNTIIVRNLANNMLRKLLRTLYHRSKIEEAKKRYAFIQSFDASKKITQRLEKKDAYSIAFLLPGLPAHSGGITTIFRLGTYLAKFGHTITYIDCENAPLEVSKRNASINFSAYQGEIITLDAVRGTYDIGVCTLWDTAYVLQSRDAVFGYKMYFLQDFEPSFYPLGDLYFLCSKTYRFGFHMISLGLWNAKKVRENFAECLVDHIEFPIETKVYGLARREIKIDKALDIAIFVKLEPKRAPDLIPQCLIVLERQLQERGIKLNCWIFGTEISFGLPFAKSLGMLTHDKLQALYHKCHMGMVASLTNISNVTFEMMASGLPVIEFEEGSAKSFFTGEQLILVDTNPRAFSATINYYVDHQDVLNETVKKGQGAIKDRTWDASAKRFNEIIQNIVLKP
jgi:glycosyltransferase involved in cell wall biosynthesis